MRGRGRKKKTFEDKYPQFVEEVQGMDRDTLKTRLTSTVQYLRETETAQKADEGLIKKRSELKEMNTPYNETKKACREKMNYVSKLIEEKGGV